MDVDKLYSQTSTLGAIRSIIPPSVDLVIGEVISETPVKIQPANDSKDTITGDRLVIPQFLTNHVYDVDISTDAYVEGGDIQTKDATPYERSPSCAHTDCSITPCAIQHYLQDWYRLRNRLHTGDQVIMIKFCASEKYLLIDKVADQSDEGAI